MEACKEKRPDTAGACGSEPCIYQANRKNRKRKNKSILFDFEGLAKVLPISLDSLINPDVSPEDEGANQMKMLYCSCPSEMRGTLLHHTRRPRKN